MNNGIYEKLDFEEYKSHEGINSSKLKTLVNDEFARILIFKPATDALRMGHMAHMAILEPHLVESQCNVMPDINRRTNDGKAQYKEFIETYGDNYVKTSEFEDIKEMSKALHREGTDTNALISMKEMKREASLFCDLEGMRQSAGSMD